MCGGGFIPPRYGDDTSWGTATTGTVNFGVKEAADALSLNSLAFGFNVFFAGAAAVVTFAAASDAPAEVVGFGDVVLSFAASPVFFSVEVVVAGVASDLVSLPFAAGALGCSDFGVAAAVEVRPRTASLKESGFGAVADEGTFAAAGAG